MVKADRLTISSGRLNEGLEHRTEREVRRIRRRAFRVALAHRKVASGEWRVASHESHKALEAAPAWHKDQEEAPAWQDQEATLAWHRSRRRSWSVTGFGRSAGLAQGSRRSVSNGSRPGGEQNGSGSGPESDPALKPWPFPNQGVELGSAGAGRSGCG